MGAGGETADDGASDCCPETQAAESASQGEDDDQHGDDCCCDGVTACSDSDTKSLSGIDAMPSTFETEHELEGPTFWLTPDLVATLWLVERLAANDGSTTSVPPPLDEVRTDRSDSYLKHSILLI